MKTRRRQQWWRRVGSADAGFRYADGGGGAVEAADALERIAGLVIPPGWADVHVSPDPRRKVQAWGRDAAGRKQYIYSSGHVAARDRRKWGRVLEYGRVLPMLRGVTNEHLKLPRHHRERVLATVVRLMSRAYFRVGSERYAVRNRTFGICTLAKSHLRIDGRTLHFRFRGKRRQDQRRVIAATPLVEIVRELLELPGPRLFQYRDGHGAVRPVTADGVNRYLREILGARYTSKDLRTFGGTVRAATVLADLGPGRSATDVKRNLALCCRLVAHELGNTPAIARSAYIHPIVLNQYGSRGRTIDPLMRKAPRPVEAQEPVQLYPEEAALIRFLERYG